MYAFSQRLTCAFHARLPSATNLRHFATKGKNVSDIIRLNAENKMLFGSKIKDVKKTSKSSSDATKPTKKKKISTKKKKKSTVDDATEQRLQDMYQSSLYFSSFNTEIDEKHNGSPVVITNTLTANKSTEQEFVPNYFDEVHIAEGQEVLVDDSACLEYFPEERTNDVHIPKILPVPSKVNRVSFLASSGETSLSPKCKTSPQSSTGGGDDNTASSEPKKVETLDTPTPEEMDFVLHCPVLPPTDQELVKGAQEFRTLIETLELRLLPTVNMVLNKTRSELSLFFLNRWRQNMIQELGEEGFKKHQEKVIWNGTNFHACVQQYLSGMPLNEIQVQESNQGHWASLTSVLPDVSEVQALETPISHPWLFYRGTFDCVAKYKDVLYVIDWKTSEKAKPLLSNLYDNPLQVAAYLGAVNLNAQFTSKFGVVDHAAIVVAYQNGQPAHVHRLKPALCQHYWSQWCQRLHQYWTMVAAEKGLQVNKA